MKKVSYERAREILNQILIENNCLNEYFENIKNYNQGKSFVDKEKYEKSYEIISSEFSWSGTPSGASFWGKMSTTFIQKLKEEESKEPTIKEKAIIEVEVGSSTWAFHQMVVNDKRVRHKDDDNDFYIYWDGGMHILDKDEEVMHFENLADYPDGWSIYEGE